MENDLKDATKRLDEIRKARAITNAELARVAGISIGTLYNIRCGNAMNSHRARQAMSEYLGGAQIWDDIRPAKRCTVFKRGMSIEFQSIEDAKQGAKELRGVAIRRGSVITFIEECSFITSLGADPQPRVVREQTLHAKHHPKIRKNE